MLPSVILRCSAAALIINGVHGVPVIADEPIPVPPATSWSEVYDRSVLRSLNVAISEVDWATVQADESFSIETPARFWVDGEGTAYDIAIRRKSAAAIGEKISYKVDFRSTRWQDLKNINLENGDGSSVVSEGFAWILHNLASSQNYKPGLAAWTTLTVHVERAEVDEAGNPLLDEAGNPIITVDSRPQGVYLHVESPDKQFLRHRSLWSGSTAFFYKQDDIGPAELRETPDGSDSPALKALVYSPFQPAKAQGKKVLNPTPSDAVLSADLSRWINMDAMLRLGAANAYADNPDELFNKGKNYYWVDYATTATDYRRIYFPWDLDASVRDPNAGIYANLSANANRQPAQHPYQQVILNHATYRAQYNAILTELVNGPYAPANLQSILTEMEVLLTPYLLSDPNNLIGNTPEAVADYFVHLRDWVATRHSSVSAQLIQNGPPAPRPPQ
jgi:hypothetical protein